MNNKTKLIIIVTTLFLSAATHNLQANFFDNTQKTESGTSGDNESDNSTGGFFESDNSTGGFFESDNSTGGFFYSENSNSINRAAPTGNEGDAQKMPISDGTWILIGLVVSYGLVKMTKHRVLKK